MKHLIILLKNILCKIGIHNYEINQYVNYKGKFECFRRTCQYCNKEQELKRPEKYHPSKWIWETLILLLILSSCQSYRAERKIGWLKEKGYLSDTAKLEATSTKGSKAIQVDSNELKNALDSLTDMYMAMLDSCGNLRTKDGIINIQDSTKKEVVRKAIKQKIKDKLLNIPCTFEAISDSTQRYLLKIWVSEGKINYTLNIPEQKVGLVQTTKVSWWHKFLEHFSIGVLCCAIFVMVLKKYT